MKNIIYFSFLIIISLSACQDDKSDRSLDKLRNTKPKLVVGIVIDQFRPEYLDRFQKHFGNGGFNRLLDHGFVNKNVHFNYIPTYTGPGHASVYTGSTPKHHGIIANNWYDKENDEGVYCVEDNAYSTIGSNTDNGKMSPRRLLSTTVTDELKLSTNFKSKVIGIAIKDRGSILPAGHLADGAFWYDKETGDFISSTYYFDSELPQWVVDFNQQKKADEYLNQSWDLIKDKAEYQNSTADNMPYERVLRGKNGSTFPYDLSTLRADNGNFALLPGTPFGNMLTTDMALAALEGEEMGKDEVTDFLAISYSSTDYIGHAFGPRSVEIEDTYIRMDLEIERLLNELDRKVGSDNYILMITSDHGCSEVPEYLESFDIPAGHYRSSKIESALDSILDNKYGASDWIKSVSNEQVFFNLQAIERSNLRLKELQEYVRMNLLKFEGIAEAYTGISMQTENYTSKVASALQRGYNFKKSGDVLFTLQPGWFGATSSATTHGSGYNYDTHAPLLWYGQGIPQGESYKRQSITDIAVTLSNLLQVQLPNAATGEVIEELF